MPPSRRAAWRIFDRTTARPSFSTCPRGQHDRRAGRGESFLLPRAWPPPAAGGDDQRRAVAVDTTGSADLVYLTGVAGSTGDIASGTFAVDRRFDELVGVGGTNSSSNTGINAATSPATVHDATSGGNFITFIRLFTI